MCRAVLGEVDADVGRMRRDEVSGGIEPDVAIDGALGAAKRSTRAMSAVATYWFESPLRARCTEVIDRNIAVESSG